MMTFLLLICWQNTIRGFKEVKGTEGTKLLYVYHKALGNDGNCFQCEKKPKRA